MTVTTTTARFSYVGDGSAGPDTATGVKVLSSTDVKVYWSKGTTGSGTPVTVGDTSVTMSASGYLTLNTHYTVQNAGTVNDITITLIASGWTISSTLAYATSSDTLVVTREVPYTQPSNYQNNDTFDAETLEQSLDRSTMQIQQLSDVADRNFVFSSTLGDSEFNSDSVSGTDFSTIRERASTITTTKASRASKALRFDSNGDIGVSTYDPDGQVVLAKTYADSATADAVQTGLDASSCATAKNDAQTAQARAELAESNARDSETNALSSKNSALTSAATAQATSIAMAIALGIILTPILI